MKIGYDIFGKAYSVMLRNDPHAKGSVDHMLLQNMVLLEESSVDLLYKTPNALPDLSGHPLFAFAQSFRGINDRETVENLLQHCAAVDSAFDEQYDNMLFGGTEEQILRRGTDWCADMARVGAVLLQCCGIPARIVHLVNPDLAYYGHVVTEAWYDGQYGVCDFLHGLMFYDDKPLSIRELLQNPGYLRACPEGYWLPFGAAAISEYDITKRYDYSVSRTNRYTSNVIHTDHQGKWFMGEDHAEKLSLELLTQENLKLAQSIQRDDIPESWVDTADTLWELTLYGLEHGCIGHTYVVKYSGVCIGLILLGEAILWETDPEEMTREPFYRLMGFIIDQNYRGQGIGGIVLETVIEAIFQEFGVRPIALGIHRDNINAVRFYERHGFRATAATEGNDRYYLRYPEGGQV